MGNTTQKSIDGLHLSDFIDQVKKELLKQIGKGEHDFRLNELEIEATVALDSTSEARGSLLRVVELGGKVSAANTHKVKLKLTPLVYENDSRPPSDNEGPNEEEKNQQFENRLIDTSAVVLTTTIPSITGPDGKNHVVVHDIDPFDVPR